MGSKVIAINKIRKLLNDFTKMKHSTIIMVICVIILLTLFWYVYVRNHRSERHGIQLEGMNTKESKNKPNDPTKPNNTTKPNNPNKPKEVLRFSNTQKLDDVHRQWIEKDSPCIQYRYKYAPRRDPPTNNSQETRNELNDIKEKMKVTNTNESLRQRIEMQKPVQGILDEFGILFEEREELVDEINSFVNPVIMRLKVEYDRVRPSHLDKSIKPSINVPDHPSYPSGHATQSYYIAYRMSQKYPQKRLQYLNNATRIARNREYAGVHYKSDTDYGREIAEFLSNQCHHETN